MKQKIALVLFWSAVAAMAQRPTRSPSLRPEDNTNSTCRVQNSMECANGGTCLERRVPNRDSVVYDCSMPSVEGESCSRRDILEGNDTEEESRRVMETTRIGTPLDRMVRDRAQGIRDRSSARTITGVAARATCAENQRCNEQEICSTRPTATQCEIQRNTTNTTRCDANGNFRPLQCMRQDTGIICFCVNHTNGAEIPGSRTSVINRKQLPDCTTQSFRSCSVRRDGRRVKIRHGQSVTRQQSEGCMKCRCNNGVLECSRHQGDCRRSNQNQSPRNCTMNGVTVVHNEQRQIGKCNRCGCRNGRLQCTRHPSCREERDPDGDDREETERERVDRECDDCNNEDARPVCAVRDGRTFRTRCHALACQGLSRDDIEDGPCAERDNCAGESPCGMNFTCLDLGGETRMSRQRNRSEDRRLCVNRHELRCHPTEIRDGKRRVVNEDPFEETLSDDDDENDVCASDGNTYPSTCHMMVESRGDQIPHVRHSGSCRPTEEDEETMPTTVTNRTVCGRDGVTYSDAKTMRTRGGNVEPDYMGRCMRTCAMVRENNMCPNLTGCTRRVRPADGCCPICGSVVTMAMDQEAVDEHVETTGELHNVDDFMDRFFRARGKDEEGRVIQPLINSTTTDRCNISMTRPTQIPGNNTEIVFKARNLKTDATFCHESAMKLARRLNNEDEGSGEVTVTLESSLVAAATVAPEDQITEESDALTFAGSCVVVLSAYIITFLF